MHGRNTLCSNREGTLSYLVRLWKIPLLHIWCENRCPKWPQATWDDHEELTSFPSTTSNTTPVDPRLHKYQQSVRYVPGKYLYIADTLSRAFLHKPDDQSVSELHQDSEIMIHSLVRNQPVPDEKLIQLKKATSIYIYRRNPTILLAMQRWIKRNRRTAFQRPEASNSQIHASGNCTRNIKW